MLRPVEELLDQTQRQPSRRHLLDQALGADRPPNRPDLQRELANLSHLAGRVAQDQRRFTDAEQAYRQALDLKLEFDDRHSAAGTYGQLGVVAQEQRRFAESLSLYLRATLTWHSATSVWPDETLALIKQLRLQINPQEYQCLLAQHVSPDLLDNLANAIEETSG